MNGMASDVPFNFKLLRQAGSDPEIMRSSTSRWNSASSGAQYQELLGERNGERGKPSNFAAYVYWERNRKLPYEVIPLAREARLDICETSAAVQGTFAKTASAIIPSKD